MLDLPVQSSFVLWISDLCGMGWTSITGCSNRDISHGIEVKASVSIVTPRNAAGLQIISIRIRKQNWQEIKIEPLAQRWFICSLLTLGLEVKETKRWWRNIGMQLADTLISAVGRAVCSPCNHLISRITGRFTQLDISIHGPLLCSLPPNSNSRKTRDSKVFR